MDCSDAGGDSLLGSLDSASICWCRPSVRDDGHFPAGEGGNYREVAIRAGRAWILPLGSHFPFRVWEVWELSGNRPLTRRDDAPLDLAKQCRSPGEQVPALNPLGHPARCL